MSQSPRRTKRGRDGSILKARRTTNDRLMYGPDRPAAIRVSITLTQCSANEAHRSIDVAFSTRQRNRVSCLVRLHPRQLDRPSQPYLLKMGRHTAPGHAGSVRLMLPVVASGMAFTTVPLRAGAGDPAPAQLKLQQTTCEDPNLSYLGRVERCSQRHVPMGSRESLQMRALLAQLSDTPPSGLLRDSR